MSDPGNDDVWQALQGGPKGAGAKGASTPAEPSLAQDASNDDVASALASGPQGAAVASQAPWYKHYPAMLGQVGVNALGDTANLGIGGFNWLNRNAPFLKYKFRGDEAKPVQIPEIPSMDLGAVAQPQGWGERLAAAGAGSGAVALATGGAGDIPAILQGSGKELLREVPSLLRQAGVLGVAPGVAAEGANQALNLDAMPPAIRNSVEIATGMAAAIAAHRFAGADPFTSVPAKLGTSETAEHAGDVTQKAVRDWRGDLPNKVEALKGITSGPLTPEGDVIGDKLFGKIPLDSATADMTETLKVVNTMANKGGMVAPLLHEFGNDMPVRVKKILEDIASKNNPIMEFPPKAAKTAPGVVSAGPVGENPPQMTRGTMPPYGAPNYSRGDTHQGLQVVSPQGEVGFHLPEPPESPIYTNPAGTITGFPLPLRDAMELRSWIGEQTSRGMMPKGTTPAQWDALYKGPTNDIGNVAELYGARPEWDTYNAKTSQLYTDGAKFAKFSNDDNPTKDTAKPGEATSKLWNSMEKDSGDIATLREHLPGAADEIAAAYLRQSPEKWGRLVAKNPDAAKALVPNPFDRLALSSATGERPSLLSEAQRQNRMLKGAGLGAGLGELLQIYNNTHTGSQLLSPFVAGMAGMALPIAGEGLEHVVKNPRLLKVPATGALATNPLLSQPDKSQ
jgi:hypothetical protein